MLINTFVRVQKTSPMGAGFMLIKTFVQVQKTTPKGADFMLIKTFVQVQKTTPKGTGFMIIRTFICLIRLSYIVISPVDNMRCKQTPVLWMVLFLVLILSSIVFSNPLTEVDLTGKWPPNFKDFIYIELPSLYQCIELCLGFKLCRTAGYYKPTSLCEIIYDDIYRNPWRIDNGMIVFSKPYLPKLDIGNCSEHGCKIDETCVATASGKTCLKHGFNTIKCPPQSIQTHDTCIWPGLGNHTWAEAQNACGPGAALLEVTSERRFHQFIFYVYDYLCIYVACSFPRNFWIGLKYSSKHSNFVWNTTGKILTSADFHTFDTFPSLNQTDSCFGIYQKFGNKTLQMAEVDCELKSMVACQLVSLEHWQ
ncbi:uncharacterized protein [Argopecten irradians]|uniref:uncharacterized protein n=1 Tax=Argopecten irradians TaxID=31199 RepID=UPI0037213274